MARRMGFHKVSAEDEIGYFAPKTWWFWRSLIVCFCAMCIIGHWLEIPYCWAMGTFFGIVDEEYALAVDPWWHPYWVYGFGAFFMTILVEPLKEYLIKHSRNLGWALLKCFIIAVFLSMLMELIMGWLINQPDEFGKYPYWDNSYLPLNIFGQAWLVNDLFIGFAAMIYVWIVFPLVCEGFDRLKPRTANIVFGVLVALFLGCCAASYATLIINGILG